MRRHLTYANVVATLALVFALGLSGAYAASKIGSKDIKKGAIKSKAIKDGTITGKDIKDRAVGPADLAPATVFTPELLNGGQDDCLWRDVSASTPGLEAVAVRKDGYGQVSFTGMTSAVDGPGGDGMCSGAGPDAGSDSQMFVLPPELRPTNAQFFFNPANDSVIVVSGVNGISLGGSNLPPGAVWTAVSGPAYLNVVGYLAADAPNSPAPMRAPARIKRSLLP